MHLNIKIENRMKAVMIVMDQAHYDQVVKTASLNIRGFTSWKEVYGKEPAWDTALRHACLASINNAILTVVEDDRVPLLLNYLKEEDKRSVHLGLRAFVWNIEEMI